MKEYILYTAHYITPLVRKIQESEYDDEIKGTLRTVNKGVYTAVIYCSTTTEMVVLETLAHIIGEIVQQYVLEELTDNVLQQKKELSIQDRKEIKNSFIANNYLSRQDGFSYITYYLVYLPLLDMIKKSNSINIEGWITFRMQGYKAVLEDMLEEFVAEYLAKKEMLYFIRLAREMSRLKEPIEDTLHLVYEPNGMVNIFNAKMENKTQSYIKEYCEELSLDNTLNKEDLLMHIFITLCPRKIIVHQQQNARRPQFLQTLQGLFWMQISYCGGCDFCKKQLHQESQKET